MKQALQASPVSAQEEEQAPSKPFAGCSVLIVPKGGISHEQAKAWRAEIQTLGGKAPTLEDFKCGFARSCTHLVVVDAQLSQRRLLKCCGASALAGIGVSKNNIRTQSWLEDVLDSTCPPPRLDIEMTGALTQYLWEAHDDSKPNRTRRHKRQKTTCNVQVGDGEVGKVKQTAGKREVPQQKHSHGGYEERPGKKKGKLDHCSSGATEQQQPQEQQEQEQEQEQKQEHEQKQHWENLDSNNAGLQHTQNRQHLELPQEVQQQEEDIEHQHEKHELVQEYQLPTEAESEPEPESQSQAQVQHQSQASQASPSPLSQYMHNPSSSSVVKLFCSQIQTLGRQNSSQNLKQI